MAPTTSDSDSDSDSAAKEGRLASLRDILVSSYGVTDDGLVKALCALAEGTCQVAILLSNYVDHDDAYAGTRNSSGDDQLNLDLDCDAAVFAAVRESGAFSVAASEETPEETDVSPAGGANAPGGSTFSLGFDPLDGSSIIGANFSVGSIYGVWPGIGVLGRTGREQAAAAVALYGPRTTLLVALPAASSGNGHPAVVFEVTLVDGRARWGLSRRSVALRPEGRVFAPGNLRASNDNDRYGSLIRHWMEERYTLRYTGGMVPDVCHMFAKGGGVFSNVSSDRAKAKLRLLYEVAPLGLVVECAGGATTHEARDGSVLDCVIDDLDRRLGVCIGSTEEVEKYKKFMFEGGGGGISEAGGEEKKVNEP